MDRVTGSQREYIHWLLSYSAQASMKVETILTEEAIDLIATKLRTPLQVQRYLTLALELVEIIALKFHTNILTILRIAAN